ncbi:MAG: PAS domain S-box protein [Verrucomicrobia bacterium]|nr:PAS domain S-box protein [Verrucomicrobiota bacterium]
MKTPLRVLVVEDSEFDARMLISVLRRGGYDATYERVETSAELDQALSSKPWDVLLADYNMPSFSAPEALKLLQAKGVDLPFIIISGGIGEDIAVAAMKSGAHDYLMKGNLTRLVPAVEREIREAQSRAARRQAERSVRESELRYRLLWETATDAVILMDKEGAIHFVNPAAELLFGHKPEDLIGRNFTMLLPSRLHPEHHQRFSRIVSESTALPSKRRVFESIGARRDATEVLIEVVFNDLELHGNRLFVAFVRDITERRRAELELKENEEQFRVAREIQQRLFPKSAPTLDGFDIAGISYPAEAAGGDYFDYLPMHEGGLGIAIADVTGHGIGPSMIMAETRAYLRILALNRTDPGEILTRANLALSQDLGFERYVTLLLARLDAPRRLLTHASAGHPPGCILAPDGSLRDQLKRTGIPLGIKADSRFTSAPPVRLEPGELVLLLTDGVDEAMSPQNELFGMDRVLAVLREHRHRPAAHIVNSLYDAMRAFRGDVPQEDDFTAIIIKVL